MFALSLLLAVASVYSDSHSLRYYYTGVSDPGHGIPEFSIVGYVDDQHIDLYSSDIGRSIPVASWLKKKERPKHWERMTRTAKEHEALFREEVKIGMKRFNHSGGFHLVQVMHHCELRDDGSVIGYQHYRYDGREFMYLDLKTATYIPTMGEAQITTQRWNHPDVRMGERAKNLLENTCAENLKRFIMYGREELEQRVRPWVKVSGQEKDGAMKLHCQVYGFHPRAVDVKWMNGEDEIPSYETTHVLPNPDGTYQIRVSTEVTPKDGASYSCYVDHRSLEEPLNIVWEPRTSSVGLIVGVIAGVIALLGVVIGAVVYKKKKSVYKPTSTSDTSSDTANPPVTV